MVMGALSGGDPFEIIVALKDLASEGFGKIRAEMASTEAASAKTNLSGFSGAAKTAEKDAAAAAESTGGLGASLVGMAGGPVTLAAAGLAAVAAGGLALTKTYDDVERQEKAAATAAKDHGIALDDLNAFMEQAIKENEDYGFGADDTRGAVTKLTEAGISLADQQKAMGPIADLAKAKQISLTDAATAYELAVMGNARALKEFGIALPKVTDAQSQADKATKDLASAKDNLAKAQDAVTAAQARFNVPAETTMKLNLATQQATDAVSAAVKKYGADSEQASIARQKLAIVEENARTTLQGSAADQAALQKAQDNVTAAQQRLTDAQTKADATQKALADTGARTELINKDLTQAVGDQRSSVTEAEKAHARLGDAWQHLATVVGPPLEAFFSAIIEAVTWLVNRLSDLIGWLGRVGSAVANSPLGGFIKMVAGFVGGVAGQVANIISSIGNAIPHFAAGGVVEPRAGGTVALLGEAGEREYVIPESRMGAVGGGATTVHAHLYLDGQEIAYAMERPLAGLLNLRGTSAVNFGGA